MRKTEVAEDLLASTGAAMVTAVSGVLVLRLAAAGLGLEEFGTWAVAKRAVAALTPVATLGMSVAVVRTLAATGEPAERHALVWAGAGLGIGPAMVLVIGAFAFPARVATLVFDRPEAAHDVRAGAMLLLSYAAYTILYSIYRGQHRFHRAAIVQIAFVGIGPLAVTWYLATQGTASLVLWGTAILSGLSIVPLARELWPPPIARNAFETVGRAVRELLVYGFPRLPATFALGLLVGFSALVAPHIGTMTEAGYLATAQILMTAADTGLVAIGLVALPRIAAMTTASRREELDNAVAMLLPCSFHIAVFAQVQALVWADTAAAVLLGAHSGAAFPLVRAVLTAVGGYVVYVMLRAVIDAVEVKPINTINLMMALLLAVILASAAIVGGFGSLGVAASQSIGVNALGVMTVLYLARRYRVPASAFNATWATGLSLVAGALALATHVLIRGRYGPPVQLGVGALVVFVTTAGYLTALNALGTEWVSAVNSGFASFFKRWTV